MQFREDFMKCPQCVENLGASNYKGFGVRSCLYCDGIWVGKEVLAEIVAGEPGAPGLDSISASFKGRQGSARSCPSCGDKMKKNLVNNIELDFCLRCEGIFFDQGELSQLAPNARNKSEDLGFGGYAGMEMLFWIIIGIFSS